MLISGFATLLAIAVVIGVIGYRIYRGEEAAAPAEVTAHAAEGREGDLQPRSPTTASW